MSRAPTHKRPLATATHGTHGTPWRLAIPRHPSSLPSSHDRPNRRPGPPLLGCPLIAESLKTSLQTSLPPIHASAMPRLDSFRVESSNNSSIVFSAINIILRADASASRRRPAHAPASRQTHPRIDRPLSLPNQPARPPTTADSY